MYKIINSRKYKGRELEDFSFNYQLNKKNMENGLLKLNKANLQSAVVYGLLSIALLIISKGTVFGLDWKVLLDVGVLGLLTSIVKNLLTTDKGNFAGVIDVIPDKN